MNSPATSRVAPASRSSFDVDAIRAEFPILAVRVHGKPLVYFDNAATTQKPRAVIESQSRYYEAENSNIHRGVHALSELATREYEGARDKVRSFLNAHEDREIVWTRGTTEAINLVAQSYGRHHVGPGDEVLVTTMEHHSNIVPWQLLCDEKGAKLRAAPIDDRGQIVMAELEKLLSPRTKIVSVGHVSNALGTVNPVAEIVRLAHEKGAVVLIDGAQAVAHLTVDVQALDCDFYAFSGHKLYGPTGTGVLYGKAKLLEAMPPWQGGGDMISSVSFEKTTWNALPYKFEAGTPNIAGGIGLGVAIDYLLGVGIERAAAWEHELLEYATAQLGAVPGLRIVGTAEQKAAVVSFMLADIHPHDVGTILDREGIAIRTGHHCAQPVMTRFGIPATARASFAFYNTKAEIDALVAGLKKVLEVFK
jgi:cysteine desulfurase / selenocysteine lyase